jgi:hypothetical protein
MLCQFSTALLARTASSQTCEPRVCTGAPVGRQAGQQVLLAGTQDAASRPCPAQQVEGLGAQLLAHAFLQGIQGRSKEHQLRQRGSQMGQQVSHIRLQGAGYVLAQLLEQGQARAQFLLSPLAAEYPLLGRGSQHHDLEQPLQFTGHIPQPVCRILGLSQLSGMGDHLTFRLASARTLAAGQPCRLAGHCHRLLLEPLYQPVQASLHEARQAYKTCQTSR